jgi:regulator of protease activity HflC (stomatin/prohibitin superfamily)
MNNNKAFQNFMKNKNLGGFGFIGLGTLILGVGLIDSIYSVEAAHRAVVYSRIFGVKNQVYGEGVHFKIPFIERPTSYSIRKSSHEITDRNTEQRSTDDHNRNTSSTQAKARRLAEYSSQFGT